MITVRVEINGQELALIRIQNLEEGNGLGKSLYAAEFVYDKMRGATGVVRKTFWHNRLEQNILALLKEALATLEPHNLEFEGGPVSPSDLAWRFRGAGAKVQGWARQLRNH